MLVALGSGGCLGAEEWSLLEVLEHSGPGLLREGVESLGVAFQLLYYPSIGLGRFKTLPEMLLKELVQGRELLEALLLLLVLLPERIVQKALLLLGRARLSMQFRLTQRPLDHGAKAQKGCFS